MIHFNRIHAFACHPVEPRVVGGPRFAGFLFWLWLIDPTYSRANQLFLSGGGNKMVAVIPVNSLRSWFGTDTLIANVFTSRFVRLTSRWVAKSFSTPLKNTWPCKTSPDGNFTRSVCPNRTESM